MPTVVDYSQLLLGGRVCANPRPMQAKSVARIPRLIPLGLMLPVMDGWQFGAVPKAEAALAGVPVVAREFSISAPHIF